MDDIAATVEHHCDATSNFGVDSNWCPSLATERIGDLRKDFGQIDTSIGKIERHAKKIGQVELSTNPAISVEGKEGNVQLDIWVRVKT